MRSALPFAIILLLAGLAGCAVPTQPGALDTERGSTPNVLSATAYHEYDAKTATDHLRVQVNAILPDGALPSVDAFSLRDASGRAHAPDLALTARLLPRLALHTLPASDAEVETFIGNLIFTIPDTAAAPYDLVWGGSRAHIPAATVESRERYAPPASGDVVFRATAVDTDSDQRTDSIRVVFISGEARAAAAVALNVAASSGAAIPPTTDAGADGWVPGDAAHYAGLAAGEYPVVVNVDGRTVLQTRVVVG